MPATICFKKCQWIPITGNNRPPIGIGSCRLSIDLEPIVEGVIHTHTRYYCSYIRRLYLRRCHIFSHHFPAQLVGSVAEVLPSTFPWSQMSFPSPPRYEYFAFIFIAHMIRVLHSTPRFSSNFPSRFRTFSDVLHSKTHSEKVLCV